MAIVSAATWKTQNAAIAVALTVQYKDSAAVKVADQIANPKHPLRDALKLLNFNASTGVFTSNDALVDAIYAGGNSALGIQLDKQTEPVVAGAAGTALVADATPTIITLTPVKALTGIEGISVTVGGTAIGVVGYIGNNQIQLQRAIVAAEVVVIANAVFKYADLSYFTATALAVTNNVA